MNNPYIVETINLLGEIKGWIMGLVAAVTLVAVAWHGVRYQGGDDAEKANMAKKIRNDLLMGGGIFFLVWLAGYIITKFQSVQVTFLYDELRHSIIYLQNIASV